MSLFADVAFPIPLAKSFSYKVPESMEQSIATGVRVLAPFGPRKKIGYIIHLTPTSSFEKTKELIQLLNPEISIPDSLMQLAQWIAGYYLCSIGEVIHAIFPSMVDNRKVSYAVLTEKGEEYLADKENITAKDTPFLELIASSGRLPKGKLTTLLKSCNEGSALARMKRKGLVYIEEEVLATQSKKKKKNQNLPVEQHEKRSFQLNIHQENAIQKIAHSLEKERYETFLLQGVTGSGKTEVYLKSAEKAVTSGKNVIMLVPEIGLTYQVVARFLSQFGEKLALLHSGLTPVERFNEWKKIREGSATIVIGARSAIFAPFKQVALIIVDEEHDSAYKQEDTPRYNARDVAVMRGAKERAVVLLGSATPSLETYQNARTDKYSLLTLPERIDSKPMPSEEIIDLKGRFKEGAISEPLIQKITERLENGEQSLLFLNRRGDSTFVQCTDCGRVWTCRNCDISLTYYKKNGSAQCHYCGYREKVTDTCPDCKGLHIEFSGIGTQKLEEEVNEIFPAARVIRIDRDSTAKRGSMEKLLQEVKRGAVDIIIGTQMISKGHDYPNITLVGILSADGLLNIPDFRSSEKTFQQISQVAGRCGRGERAGEVLVQTYMPSHYSITTALKNKIPEFYQEELELRKELAYPPFSRTICVRIEGSNETRVQKIASELGFIFDRMFKGAKGTEKLGPANAVLYRIKNKYRVQILIKSIHTMTAKIIIQLAMEQQSATPSLKSGVRIIVDVDPMNLL